MSLMTFLNNTSVGKTIAVVAVVAALGIAVYAIIGMTKGETPDDAHYTTFICTETGKAFKHKNQEGDMPPILSPYSGKNTGVIAELCYWTADGSIKKEPTPVLMNSYLGKNEPTFCPDCGRLVVQRNPGAVPGRKPPLTKAEYEARGGH